MKDNSVRSLVIVAGNPKEQSRFRSLCKVFGCWMECNVRTLVIFSDGSIKVPFHKYFSLEPVGPTWRFMGSYLWGMVGLNVP